MSSTLSAEDDVNSVGDTWAVDREAWQKKIRQEAARKGREAGVAARRATAERKAGERRMSTWNALSSETLKLGNVTPAQVRNAQLQLAAITHERASEAEEAELVGLLRMLGIYTRTDEHRPLRSDPLACLGRAGTRAGYYAHLQRYQTACPACVAWRVQDQDERWASLGATGEVIVPA